MQKRLYALLILFFMLLSFCPLSLEAANAPIPSPDSRFYVLDQAGILSQDTEDTIVGISTQLQQKTKAQIAVVTVKSLQDYSLEEYSLAILRQWGIGDKELNNGLLLLVALEERVARIEVGYGLEGPLPDAKTGQIQDEYMIGHFKNGDYNQGVMNGYLALASEVAKEYKVELNLTAPQPVTRNVEPVEKPMPSWAYVVGIVFLIFLLYLDHRYMNGFLLSLILTMLIRGGRGRGGFGGGGGGGGFGGGGSGGGGGSSRGW